MPQVQCHLCKHTCQGNEKQLHKVILGNKWVHRSARVVVTASSAPPSQADGGSNLGSRNKPLREGSWHYSAEDGGGTENTGPLETRPRWFHQLKPVTC